MILALTSFKDGHLIESNPLSDISVSDIKRTLAYALLNNYAVNVYMGDGKYHNIKVIVIKVNENGNLFFTGIYEF